MDSQLHHNPPVDGNQVWYIIKTLKVATEQATSLELCPESYLITIGLLKRDRGIVLCSTRNSLVTVSTAELVVCGRYDHDWL